MSSPPVELVVAIMVFLLWLAILLAPEFFLYGSVGRVALGAYVVIGAALVAVKIGRE